MNKRDIIQKAGFGALGACMALTLASLLSILAFIAVKGAGVISWDFLTKAPVDSMTGGGIAPVILGTFYLTLGAVIFSLPLGLASAIYLTEYSPKGWVVNLIRIRFTIQPFGEYSVKYIEHAKPSGNENITAPIVR